MLMGKQAKRDCSNSPRHVAKVHGSHNARWNSWPHYQDFLDRPKPLHSSTVPTVGKSGRKVTHPQVRTKEGRYTGDGRWSQDQPTPTVYLVEAVRACDDCVVSVRVSARSETEAVEIGTDVMEFKYTITNVTAHPVRGANLPAPAKPLPPKVNRWIV